MKAPFESVILTSLYQRCRLVIKAQRLVEPLRPHFHDACSDEDDCLQIRVLVLQLTQRTCQVYAGFVIRAFAPVTECEIAMRFGCFAGLTEPFENFNALGN